MDLPSTSPLDLRLGLRKLGFEAFRPGQREAIEVLLDAGALLLVAPTGGGKSLTYQLPATLLGGTTVVVSPLVALMQDQVQALQHRGVNATYLAATLSPDEMRRRMAEVGSGRHTLVYVAPERLAFPGFRGLLERLDIPLVAVDEAHCISEWGHDFRPEYLQIGTWLRDLSPPRVLACTATATPVVRDEIIARLGLPPDTPQVVRGFARPNLALRVREIERPTHRARAVDEQLAAALGDPGHPRGTAIVYAPTRKAAEEEAARLATRDWRAAAYHAGMTGNDRDAVQRRFTHGKLDVVVATNAFGMGIDRADVRAVIHLAPPGSIEAYYQEVGRAGRDGAPAFGLLIVPPGAMALRRRLIERNAEGASVDPAVVEHKWNLFLELMRWSEGGSCRHDAILRYFGDEAETLAGCGRCDVCESLSDGNEGDAQAVEETVRKALSAVARVHGRFGFSAAVKLLRGMDDPRLQQAGLTRVRTFGVLADRSEEWLGRLLRRCMTAGWIDVTTDRHPVVFLTESGKAVMTGARPARLLLPPTGERSADPKDPRRSQREAVRGGEDLDEAAARVFEILRGHRLEWARAEGVPPYVVASDRTLRDIALLRPRTLDELAMAHGIGPAKLERWGERLLRAVRAATTASA